MLSLPPATFELGAAASEAERRRLARFDPDAPPEARKRRWLFWTVCLPLRSVLAACAALAGTERCAPVEFVLAAYALYWGVNLLQNFARQLLRSQLSLMLAVASLAAAYSAPTAPKVQVQKFGFPY